MLGYNISIYALKIVFILHIMYIMYTLYIEDE